ncbi:alanine racemase [Candidatus Curtissbacteria bacterium]|nr:alanine racemase [Candidatus Curtissbacteria bacterium]
MIRIIRRLQNKEYVPLNRVEVSKSALVNNYRYLASCDKRISIAPVLKSNAYGHGLIKIAKTLDNLGCPMFCVDSLHEAYELSKGEIKTPIFIMGYINPPNLKIKKLNFTYAIYDFRQAEILNQFQPGSKVHVKVDTGMNRLGVPLNELGKLITKIKKLKNIEIVGLMSHFSSPKVSKPYTDYQTKNFKEALKILRQHHIEPEWRHLAASGGLLNNVNSISKITNMARVGISLFGLYRTGKFSKLKPVLKLTSQIVQLKRIKKGEYIGYDMAYRANSDMKIAVLPIGYNDGVERRLTNKGFIKVGNKFCRVVGKVSMNITTIDVTDVDVRLGNKVVVYSDKIADVNSLENVAANVGTIPHELLVHLNPASIRREIVP